ncbi:MAG: radical SAM protein [Pirellulaceae bacterium]|nr:radical SAM protein [Pirellulaceae bacterium]
MNLPINNNITSRLPLRDYTFLGTTQSLCPTCLTVVPAKIIARGQRVYFRKTCPTHGVREDYICSDVAQFDQMQFSVPAKKPLQFGTAPDKGCPLDCGLCSEHEQHTCIGLVELTSSCNLKCPMCYASSGPGGKHLSFEDCCRAIDRLVEVEGRPEILQLSGGEPTIHPEFRRVMAYALEQPIDYVMINSNGLRFAHEPDLVQWLSNYRDRVEVYFQMDGLNDDVFESLRGQKLLATKLRALDALAEANIHTTLVCTLQGGVNEDQIGPLVEFGLARRHVTGISFQPATYSGRHVLPDELERRITFPDVIQALARETVFQESDFMPLPCAHPNCHSLAYAYRSSNQTVPLTRFFDARRHYDLIANGISFNRPGVRAIIEEYLGRRGCCSGGSCSEPESNLTPRSASKSELPTMALQVLDDPVASEFFAKALSQTLGAEDVFRITITSFLDAYNFDVRRVMKCCTHHVLPSGHVIPFCAYNVLYREGHVPLPTLDKS